MIGRYASRIEPVGAREQSGPQKTVSAFAACLSQFFLWRLLGDDVLAIFRGPWAHKRGYFVWDYLFYLRDY